MGVVLAWFTGAEDCSAAVAPAGTESPAAVGWSVCAVDAFLPRNLAIACNRFWRANCNCTISSIQWNHRIAKVRLFRVPETDLLRLGTITITKCTHTLFPLSLSVVRAHAKHGKCIPDLRWCAGGWCADGRVRRISVCLQCIMCSRMRQECL